MVSACQGCYNDYMSNACNASLTHSNCSIKVTWYYFFEYPFMPGPVPWEYRAGCAGHLPLPLELSVEHIQSNPLTHIGTHTLWLCWKKVEAVGHVSRMNES